MKIARILLILGTWIAILPYLGFPYSWKQFLFTLSGLAVMYVAYLLYKKEKIDTDNTASIHFDNFSENRQASADKFQNRI